MAGTALEYVLTSSKCACLADMRTLVLHLPDLGCKLWERRFRLQQHSRNTLPESLQAALHGLAESTASAGGLKASKDMDGSTASPPCLQGIARQGVTASGER